MSTKMYTQEGCQLKRLRRRRASAGRPHLTQYGGSAASREAISRLPCVQAPWGIAKFGEFMPDNTCRFKRIYPRIADGLQFTDSLEDPGCPNRYSLRRSLRRPGLAGEVTELRQVAAREWSDRRCREFLHAIFRACR